MQLSEQEQRTVFGACGGKCGEKHCVAWNAEKTRREQRRREIQIRIFHGTALSLCEHHKRTCDGETCNISLGTIREMAESAGVVFTEAERKEFM